MYITKTNIKVCKLDLNNTEDVKEYEEILSDPSINILLKKFITETETDYEGDYQSTRQNSFVYLEYEVCSI